MSAELTTLVWERVCVCCGASGLVRRFGRVHCAGCYRVVANVHMRGRVDLEMVARRALREVAHAEASGR